MIKKLLMGLCLCGASYLVKAQYPSHAWVKTLGAGGNDAINNMVIDASGNIYTLGTFSGTIDFDPGAATTNVTATGAVNIFVQKLDAAGNFLWVSTFDCSIHNRSNALAVNASGVYLTAAFSGTVDFDPGAGTTTIVSLPNATIKNAAVIKLTTAGALDWVKVLAATSVYTIIDPTSVAVDNLGNVYTGGSFIKTVDFNPGPATLTVTSAGGYGQDAYVVKLDNTGNYVWAKVFGGSSYVDVVPTCLKTDPANNVFISGNFYTVTNVGTLAWTVDFDPGAPVYTISVADAYNDAFISKLDVNGTFVWAKAVTAGSSDDTYDDFKCDATGNIYLTGHTTENSNFLYGSGSYTIPNIPAITYGNPFIEKIDPLGNVVWVRGIADVGYYSEGYSLALDNANNVYTTGRIGGNVDMDPGVDTFMVHSSSATANTLQDIYVSKLDQNGNFIWGRTISGGGSDAGNAIALDAQNNIYIAGYFENTANFASSPAGSATAAASGQKDAFILKWSQCGTTQTASAAAVCKYTSQAHTYTASGNYYSYTTGSGGCDSITVLSVSIQPFTASVSVNNSVFTISPPAAAYQWYSCYQGNLTSVSGQTSQTYTPANFESYAAIVVSAEGCSDTTACLQGLFIGLPDLNNNGMVLSAYPNPVKDKFTIDIAQPATLITVDVFDTMGRLVETVSAQNSSVINLSLNCRPGIYFATVKTAAWQKSIKIIKE